MNLDRGSGVALWRQIEHALAQEIADGVFAPGSRLPTEPQLSSRFGVNRHTLRQALLALADRGLIRIEQGRGTFVREDVIDYAVGPRTRFSEIVGRQDRTPGGELISIVEVPADATVAKALGIRKGAPCIRIESKGNADGQILTVGSHFISTERLPGIGDAYRETGSMTKALRKCGISDYSRKTTRVTARMPSADDAAHLKQPANRPVLVAEWLNVDSDGEPVEYGITRFASDRVQIVFET